MSATVRLRSLRSLFLPFCMVVAFSLALFLFLETRALQRHSEQMKEVSQKARFRCMEISAARTNQDAMLVGLMEMARTNREAAEFVRIFGIQPADQPKAPVAPQAK